MTNYLEGEEGKEQGWGKREGRVWERGEKDRSEKEWRKQN